MAVIEAWSGPSNQHSIGVDDVAGGMERRHENAEF
jgi:hypothetical protein